MALKFKCQNCGEDIIVKFLTVGETAKCKSCGSENVVPETAVEVIEEADNSEHEAVSEDEPKASIPPTRGISPEEMRRQILEYEQRKAEKAQRIQQIEGEILARRGFPIIVVILLAINVLLLVLMEKAGGSKEIPVLYRFGAQLNSAVVGGEYWRLFTAMFLHIGVTHLLLNCVALFYFGRAAELLYGRSRFLAIYLISGYFGNILFLAVGAPTIVSAGASGAIFGILGAHIPMNRRLKQGKLFANRKQAVVGIGYVIWIFVSSMGAGVNVWAHLGGVIAGIVLGFALCPQYLSAESTEESQRSPTDDERPKRITQPAIIGAVLVVLTIASFLLGNKPGPHGNLLWFNGGQLFYTSSVTKSEAIRLGEYFVERDIFDGNPKSMQLSKSEDTYELRIVVKEGTADSQEHITVFGLLSVAVSEKVFDGDTVEIHLCDKDLRTIKVANLEAVTSVSTIRQAIQQLGLAEAHVNQGLTYERQGKFDEAIAEYEEALKLAPNWATALNNLAWTYVRKGTDLETAVSLAQRAVELDPDSAANLDTLGWAYWKTGQTRPALSAFQRVFELEPQSRSSWEGVLEIIQSGVESKIFLEFYNELANTAPEDSILQMRLRLMLSEFHRSRDDNTQAQKALEEAERLYAKTGFPRESDWLVIGPFDNPDSTGLTITYPPETALDFSANYPGKLGNVEWQEANDDQIDGRLDFTQIFTPHEWTVAYAFVEAFSTERGGVQLRIGSDDGVKVWLNGEVVWTNRVDRGLQLDQDTVLVKLQKGTNRLLFKVDQGGGGWGLTFRITDGTGKPVKDLRYSSPTTP